MKIGWDFESCLGVTIAKAPIITCSSLETNYKKKGGRGGESTIFVQAARVNGGGGHLEEYLLEIKENKMKIIGGLS